MKKVYNYLVVMIPLMALICLSSVALAQNAWVNEIHYDNFGTDQGEFIEVVLENPGSYSLSDFEIYLYNGNNGETYDVKSLDAFSEGNPVGDFMLYYYDYPENGIQNGEPDGFALVYMGDVIAGQFLSYEGVMTATGGPASGMTSTDIGVAEPGEVGESLQLSGSGSSYTEFTWNPPAPETKGMINTGQTFGGPLPEPTNYPTDFAATSTGLSVELTWTDATGEQLPAAYLVLASTENSFITPIDGTPVPDDTDLSDGNGALNINYGVENCIFDNLEANTQYFFTIYPYTNAAANIDYKTDGDPPTTDATTADILILNYENFNDTTLGTWMQYSVTGDEQYWEAQEKYGIDNSPNAVMSGFDGTQVENEDWLISPELNILLDTYNPTLEFWSATEYEGPVLEVKLSNDYTGSGDPTTANWLDVDATLSPGDWEWTYSGAIDLSELVSEETFYLAFRYTSNTSEAASWEVDEILITAEAAIGIQEHFDHEGLKFYPNPANEIVFLDKRIGNQEIRVFDLSGRLVKEVSAEANQFSVSDLVPGIYLLYLSGNENRKLIVY